MGREAQERPQRLISSSFDYVPIRRLPAFRLDPHDCSAKALGLSTLGGSRAVIARLGGEFVLCGTRTTDFDDDEIRRTVHACGQLYLDTTEKVDVSALDELERLALSTECRACAALPACIGAYVGEGAPSAFDRDEAWLRERLRAMRGRVLDVGMGQLPYRDAFEAGVASGILEYHGIDPDPAVVENARRLALPLTLHEITIEAFRSAPAGFDHVAAIRSLNHFADVDAAFSTIASVLKPGGRLLLVESLPLPLLRSRAHSRRCQEGSQGGFQHYRNWGSGEARQVLSRFPFRIDFERAIGRDTCDQWLLEAERL